MVNWQGSPEKTKRFYRAERKIPSVQQRLHDSDRMKILFCWFILTHKCPFFFHVGFTISFLHFSVVNFIKQQGSCSLIYLFLIWFKFIWVFTFQIKPHIRVECRSLGDEFICKFTNLIKLLLSLLDIKVKLPFHKMYV